MHAGVSCNLDRSILESIIPLFEASEIECIEWSFDTLYQHEKIPTWFDELLLFFGNEGRLVGHGVFFSLFSGTFTNKQKEWLVDLRSKAIKYKFDHVTEHFGFMTGQDFHHGAPLNIPFTQDTLALAIDRIKRISHASGRPVGLENLAFSYSFDDLKQQGLFLESILQPVNGFIILDLHNLYCQIHNFNISFEDIVQLYPLDLVREIHISGGSWEPARHEQGKLIRRDTHDDQVPTEVFHYLDKLIDRLPNLKFVFLESLGAGLRQKEHQHAFRSDFLQMKSILQKHKSKKMLNDFQPPTHFHLPEKPLQLPQLAREQAILSEILERSENFEIAEKNLAVSPLAQSHWNIEKWDIDMLDTAYKIAQKWK